MTDFQKIAEKASVWPFIEARALFNHIHHTVPKKGYVLFETGYGPSGLPHIGTFGEVLRTSMIRHAFEILYDIPTRLFAFSDDMDGLRKVPDNIPNKEVLEQNLGKPLTQIPDPFDQYESFGHHNNARLKEFLDRFGFRYEFMSATECYKTGVFDDMLHSVLIHYDKILKTMLPTLGAERQATYSPFLPICPKSGIVLQVPILETDVKAGTIVYEDSEGVKTEVPVTGGHCKLQWKVDWAMRWAALGVDYEMSGKDLIDSVKLSSKICRILGKIPPVNMVYELFLDENGEKISKSKGNGLAMEEWLRYAPQESLSLFMYQKPKTAKRLFFDVIPRCVDEWQSHLSAYGTQDKKARLSNPVWHIYNASPPPYENKLSFNMILNLAGACHTEDPAILWHFISRYAPSLKPDSAPILSSLVEHAINYYRDFIKPTISYKVPSEKERKALEHLRDSLRLLADVSAEGIQKELYAIGKAHDFSSLKEWFQCLYETLLGQPQGPRMGSFIALYGIEETCALIDEALER